MEWVLGGFSKDLADRNFDSFFNHVYFKDNTIYATKRRWERPDKQGQGWGYWAYMTGSEKFECFDCVKEDFDWPIPLPSQTRIVVEKGFCQNAYGDSEDAIGSLMKMLELEPGEEKSFHIALGLEETREEINEKNR